MTFEEKKVVNGGKSISGRRKSKGKDPEGECF